MGMLPFEQGPGWILKLTGKRMWMPPGTHIEPARSSQVKLPMCLLSFGPNLVILHMSGAVVHRFILLDAYFTGNRLDNI